MNDNTNMKNMKNSEEEIEKEIKEIPKISSPLKYESEIIVNQIIEKIISLVITDSMRNKIDSLLPNFCFEEILQTLQTLTNLDFLTHDIDDLETKNKLPSDKIKSAKLRKKENSFLLKENNSFQNSEIIRDYKFEKNLDYKNTNDCSLDLEVFDSRKNEKSMYAFEKEDNNKDKDKNEEKIVMGILVREKYQEKITSFEQQEERKRKILEKGNKNFNYNFQDDKDKIFKRIYSEIEPFQVNPEEKIDTIKNVEIHRIDFPQQPDNLENIETSPIKKKIPYEKIKDSFNFWNELTQPKASKIDRDAGTKIKYEKPKTYLKRKSTIVSKEIVIEEEQKNSNKKKEISSKISTKKLKFNYSVKKSVNENENKKKKKYVQIEFESYDIDPKKLETFPETSEISELRLKVEKDILEKKKELLKIAQKEKERLAKLEELEEKRKELSKKNVTVDIKGELVYIKPLDIKALNEEFTKSRSNCKIIKTIETDNNTLKNKKNFVVEKNPEMNLLDIKEDKSKKKQKKKREYLLSTKGSTSNLNSSIIKKGEQKEKIDKPEKPETRYAAGSNFTLINPEVGVSIIENKQMKTGGKDFYQKYNRFSLELFQDTLNKTARSNFYPTITEPKNINNNNISINDKAKRRGSLNVKQNLKDIESKLINQKHQNEEYLLSVKTQNLKRALENLDLIHEGQENTNKNKLINKDIIKNALNKFGQRKIDYSEMNVFTKTLMGSHNWGGEIYSDSKRNRIYKMPKKPLENELQRELPPSLLKHMPRKRLPPIANKLRLNTLGQTSTGFYTNRKPKKEKWIFDENIKTIKTERNNL